MAHILNILAIEPSKQDAQILTKNLQGLGHAVFQASNIDQAFNTLKQSDIDLIIFAWSHGKEEIGSSELGRLTLKYPIVPVILGVSSESASLAAKEHKIFGYVLRPYGKIELSVLLRSFEKNFRQKIKPTQEVELLRLQNFTETLGTLRNEYEILQLGVTAVTQLLGQDTSAIVTLFDEILTKSKRVYAGPRYKQTSPTLPRIDGLTSTVLKSQKPLIINDVQKNKKIKDSTRKDGVEAIMMIPLQVGRSILGVLYVDTLTKTGFSYDDLYVASLLASQIANALKNIKHLNRSIKLNDLGKKLTIRHDLSTLLNLICEQATQMLDAESSCAYICSGNCPEDALEIVGKFHDGRILLSNEEEIERVLFSQRALNEAKPIINETPPYIAATPIFYQQKVIGVLDVYCQDKTRFLSEDSLFFLKSLAHYISLVIENRELYGRLQSLLSNATEGIIGIDELGYIVEFNEAAERLLGCSSEEAKQKHVSEFYFDGIDGARRVNQQLLNSPEQRLREYDIDIRRYEDGQIIPIRLSAMVHYDALGRKNGRFGYFRDRRESQAVAELANLLIKGMEADFSFQEIKLIVTGLVTVKGCYLLHYNHRSTSLMDLVTTNNLRLEYAVEGLFEEILDSSQSIILNADLPSDKTKLQWLAEELSSQFLHNSLLIPLITSQGDTFGILILTNKYGSTLTSYEAFTPADIYLLQTIARQISALLQQAMKNAAMHAFLDISDKVVAGINEQESQQQIVDILVNKLNYRMARLRFIQPDGNISVAVSAGSIRPDLNSNAYILPPGEGIASFVLKSKKMLAIRDLREISGEYPPFYFPEMIEKDEVVGMLMVPIVSEDRVIGTLTCYTGRPYTFLEEEQQLLSIFANLIAAVHINSRSYQNLKDLEKAGRVLASALNVEDVLYEIINNIPENVRGDGTFTCLFDTKKEQFDFDNAVSGGIGKDVIAWDHTSEQHKQLVSAIREKPVLLIEDIKEPPHYMFKTTQGKLLQADIRSFIGLRLQTAKEEVIGILFINYRQIFSAHVLDDEIRILRIYADLAAAAIERGVSHKRLEREKTLLESVNKVSSLNDLNATWHEILSGAITLTGADRGNISRVQPGTDYLDDEVIIGPIWSENSPRLLKIGHEGVQGWVAAHKEPALIKNVRTELKWREIYVEGNPDTVSELAVPILRGPTKDLVGVINLESSHEAAFDNNDLRLLEALAQSADIALYNVRRLVQLDTVYKATQLITQSVDRNTVLQSILGEAARLTKANFATIQEKKDGHLFFRSVYPEHYQSTLFEIIGESMPLDQPNGITTTVATTGEPWLVPNVRQCDRWISSGVNNSGSELAIPLVKEGVIWGVLNLEHPEVSAFTDEQKDILLTLGELAIIAIQRSEQSNKLSLTNSIAVMGLFGAEITHEVQRLIEEVQNRTWLLLNNPLLPPDILKHIKRIQRMATELELPPENYDLLGEVDPLSFDAAIPPIIAPFQQLLSQSNSSTSISTNLNTQNLYVVIHPYWFKKLINHLIFNAIKALTLSTEEKKEGKILIQTRLEQERIILSIEDNGPGIPQKHLPHIFYRPVPKKEGYRTGRGLLLVRFITEQYFGDCRIIYSDSKQGTRFDLSFPLRK